MSVASIAIVALLVIGCVLLIPCARAIDIREASLRDIREAEEAARHEDERRGIE